MLTIYVISMVLVAFVIGWIAGLVSKGVNININHKQQELPTEYNKQPLTAIPDDVRQYAQQNRGYNNF